MAIQGTSSLHDWESTVEEFAVQAILGNGQVEDIEFSAIVKSIKSGKSGMDNNTYKALKANDHPQIEFKTDRLRIEEDQLIGNGQLTIAGKTNEIPIRLTINQRAGLSVTGSVNIKMTDYGISPPTAVFGTIKTGDDIIIQFDFTLTNS